MKPAKSIPAPAMCSVAAWRTIAFPVSRTRPMIDVHFDQGGFDHVLGGSVGIGEVATVADLARDRQCAYSTPPAFG